MKIFVCLFALAVANCKAGIEAGYDNALSGNGGGDNSGEAHYAGPSSAGDYSGGHVQDFTGGQGGHGFSGGQNVHDFSGGQNFGFHGGQGNDYTLALTQGQDFSGHGQQIDLGNHGGLGQSYGGDSYVQAAHDLAGPHIQGDVSSEGGSHEETSGNDNVGYGGAGGLLGHGDGGQGFILQDGGHEYGDQHGFGNVEAVPVGEHVDEEHPVQVPLYKHVTVPIHKPIHVNVPKPILIGVPQPYPVKVPVHKPVAVPVETEISIPIEKVIPYPVVKHVPYPVEKHVPFKVEKTVTVHVPQPYPVKIPVYKTIYHKGHH